MAGEELLHGSLFEVALLGDEPVQRAITADTALRLGRYFGMSPQFWLNLQTHCDLEQAESRLAKRLGKEVKVLAPLNPIAA